MLTDFVTRIDEKGGNPVPPVAPGTRVYLLADPDFKGLESAVVAALDPAGEQPLGLVPGDDRHRLFTRLQRGSIATAKVSAAQTSRVGLEIDVHMEDFGGGRPADGHELLPARPPRRTDLVRFEGPAPDRNGVRDWARQLLAKAGEAENRGEDLKAFASDQHLEIQAFESTLAPGDAQRFRQTLHEEVHQLEDVPAPVFWMLGEAAPGGDAPKATAWWVRWAVVIFVAAVIYTLVTR